MIFNSEVEIDKIYKEANLDYFSYDKKRAACRLGGMVGKKFGFEKITDENKLTERYRLEIEAFPLSKWEEFLNSARLLLDNDTLVNLLQQLDKPISNEKETIN